MLLNSRKRDVDEISFRHMIILRPSLIMRILNYLIGKKIDVDLVYFVRQSCKCFCGVGCFI